MTQDDHLDLLLSLHDRAINERAAGRLDTALRLFEQALRLFSGFNEAVYGMQLTLRELAAAHAGSEPAVDLPHPAITAYLDLLERAITNLIYKDPPTGYRADETHEFDLDGRLRGVDWPSQAHTMIGLRRLHHLRRLVERVIVENVPGDLLEAGVWRGGSCILMRGVLKAYGDATRRVWVADSFQGVPPPDPAFPADRDDGQHSLRHLAISEQQVRANFDAYGLLDDQVCFLPGWFKDTVGDPRIEQLAVLRIDGDLYQSTAECLSMLYPKLAVGGFVIVDDCNMLIPVMRAVVDFRHHAGIDTPIVPIDQHTSYWRKQAE